MIYNTILVEGSFLERGSQILSKGVKFKRFFESMWQIYSRRRMPKLYLNKLLRQTYLYHT